MLISIYENAYSKNYKDVEIAYILDAIIRLKWLARIESLRTMDKAMYKTEKIKLPAVTWAGTFSDRNNNSLKQYSGLVCLDIDNIEDSVIKNIKGQLKNNPHVFAAFTSPSSRGLKIIVAVNTGPTHHRSAFLHLQHDFEKTYCFKIDDSGKDIARLCFISADADTYWNSNCTPFDVDIRYHEAKKYVMPEGLINHKPETNIDVIFKTCLGWMEGQVSYVEGSRNRFIYSMACAMNRVGVKLEITKEQLKSHYDLEPSEIDNTCRKAYFQHQGQHGDVEFKNISTHEFKAPPYVANYTDDVVVNDLMQTTAMLYHHQLPKDNIYDILVKIGKYYHQKGYIDLRRRSMGSIMNEAVNALNTKITKESDKHKLEYVKAQDLGKDILKSNIGDGYIPTNIPSVDASMRGGMLPGSFYAVIGVGGVYKSVLAQYFSVASAHLDKAVLYLCGEMSAYQFYERLCSMTLKVKLWQALKSKQIVDENIEEVTSEINQVLKDNLFFVGGSGFGKKAIMSTIQNIESSTDKKIGMVIIDGLTQMDNLNIQEIPAAINNSAICKEIAKETNIVVIALIHISGEQSIAKIRRDNGPFVRGGGKVLANTDGHFSLSLLVDPETQSLENNGDVIFREDKFYLRYVDKRAGIGTTNAIINVGTYLEIEEEECDPKIYEVKI